MLPKEKSCIFAASNSENVPVAQLVEQLTLNQWVQGSNPCGDTKAAEMPLFFVLIFLLFMRKKDFILKNLDF